MAGDLHASPDFEFIEEPRRPTRGGLKRLHDLLAFLGHGQFIDRDFLLRVKRIDPDLVALVDRFNGFPVVQNQRL